MCMIEYKNLIRNRILKA